ncbi:MAG: ribonuclease P protein component [Tannerellaceae bacterium]|jgi:ribonuclease P protein component|nr:ribonuclease P protein component [Tannerellaceae bacterium]
MTNKTCSFPKAEHLTLKRDIELLFEKGASFSAYPLRIIYLDVEKPSASRISVMISVPKKRIKKAVGRNRVKRLVREAYRMRKQEIVDEWAASGRYLLIAFLYVGHEAGSFAEMDKAMKKATRILKSKT